MTDACQEVFGFRVDGPANWRNSALAAPKGAQGCSRCTASVHCTCHAPCLPVVLWAIAMQGIHSTTRHNVVDADVPAVGVVWSKGRIILVPRLWGGNSAVQGPMLRVLNQSPAMLGAPQERVINWHSMLRYAARAVGSVLLCSNVHERASKFLYMQRKAMMMKAVCVQPAVAINSPLMPPPLTGQRSCSKDRQRSLESRHVLESVFPF